MGFLLDRKGLRSTVAQERLEALNKLAAGEKKQFIKFAHEDADAQVRLGAAGCVSAACSSCCNTRMPPLSRLPKMVYLADAGRRLKTSTLAQGKPLLDLVSDGVFAEVAYRHGCRSPGRGCPALFRTFRAPVQGLINPCYI